MRRTRVTGLPAEFAISRGYLGESRPRCSNPTTGAVAKGNQRLLHVDVVALEDDVQDAGGGSPVTRNNRIAVDVCKEDFGEAGSGVDIEAYILVYGILRHAADSEDALKRKRGERSGCSYGHAHVHLGIEDQAAAVGIEADAGVDILDDQALAVGDGEKPTGQTIARW